MEWRILYLDQRDVDALGAQDMAAALTDVENAMSLGEKGDAIHPIKGVMEWDPDRYGPANRINSMPGYLGGSYQMAGIKWIGSNPQNVANGFPRASALTILNDPETKLPLCILDGTAISAVRTGASGGVGIRYLAKETAQTLVLIGAGAQSRTQLEAAALVRPSLKQCYVADILPERAAAFARDMTGTVSFPVQAVPMEALKDYCQRADIIISATVSATPILDADWLNPGVLYIQIGGYECTYDAVWKADKRVVDEWLHVIHRKATTIAFLYADGLLHDADVYADLGEICNGKKPGRENDQEIIYYNPVGMGNEDIAIATRLYRKAKAEGVGLWLNYWY